MDLFQSGQTTPSEYAERVVFSARVHAAIVAETFAEHPNETGGILLGHFRSGVWHVIEAIDPGPGSRFSPVSFEYDTAYVNHLARKVAGLYQLPLQLIGLWHRHPGSHDHFSDDDDITNRRYAGQSPDGAISCLVNLDPHFRITAYHVPQDLHYRRLPHQVGDGTIPAELCELRRSSCLHPEHLAARAQRQALHHLLARPRQPQLAGPLSPALWSELDELLELLEQQQRFAFGLQLRGPCLELALSERSATDETRWGLQLLQIQDNGWGQPQLQVTGECHDGPRDLAELRRLLEGEHHG